MDTKIIGLVLLLCSGLLIRYGLDTDVLDFFSPSAKLQSTIQSDIQKQLIQLPSLKASQIHHFKLIYRSKDAEEFLKKNLPVFSINQKAQVWLEIEVLDLESPENPGFITQTSVFDLNTNNKISEFGHTYYLKDFDKDYKATPTSR